MGDRFMVVLLFSLCKPTYLHCKEFEHAIMKKDSLSLSNICQGWFDQSLARKRKVCQCPLVNSLGPNISASQPHNYFIVLVSHQATDYLELEETG